MKDGNDLELSYVPISGLGEGETTPVMIIKYTGPEAGLIATLDKRVTVWARKQGIGGYADLSTDPITLPNGVETIIEWYVQARSPIVGLERVPVTITAGRSNTAGWRTS